MKREPKVSIVNCKYGRSNTVQLCQMIVIVLNVSFLSLEAWKISNVKASEVKVETRLSFFSIPKRIPIREQTSFVVQFAVHVYAYLDLVKIKSPI